MITMNRKKESGFVLIQALIWVFVFAVLATALMSTSSYSTNAGSNWRKSRETLLFAESVTEKAKKDLFDQFHKFYMINDGLLKEEKMEWFDSATSDRIGMNDYFYVFEQEQASTFFDNGSNTSSKWAQEGTFSVGVTSKTIDNLTRHVTFTASATYDNKTRTVEETVEFTLNTDVFQYAYFVNYFGSMSNSNINVWGDVRGDLNFCTANTRKIHGNVYYAENMAKGDDDDEDNLGSWTHMSEGQYIGLKPLMARPLSEDTFGNEIKDGYDPDKIEHFKEKGRDDLPQLSDLATYEQKASDSNGRIYQVDAAGVEVDLITQVYDGPGPDGIVGNVDDGSIILDGRITPLHITGTIVAKGDVIILGTVTGQGSIYAEGNLHIVGDLKYLNPPVYSAQSDNIESQMDKDMVGLMASENVIVGDYTDTFWIKKATSLVENMDIEDVKIDELWNNTDGNRISGPPIEGGVTGTLSSKKNSTTITASDATLAGTYSPGDTITIGSNVYIVASVSGSDIEISPKASETTIVPGGGGDGVAVSPEEEKLPYQSTVFEDLIPKTGDVVQIDAIIYTNKIVAGYAGDLTLNGGLYAGYEALETLGTVNYVWDIRMARGKAAAVGLDHLLPKTLATPKTVYWKEVR